MSTPEGMRTVLLVDDEYAITEVLSGFLEDEGYRVLLAANGQEALACLAGERVDLVVTDMMMPVMNGRQLVEHMRASPQLTRVPILLMSAVPQSILERGGPLPVDAFVGKPFDLSVLLDALAQLLPPG